MRILRSLLVAFLMGLTLACTIGAAEPARSLDDLTGTWQLLIDEYLIADRTDVVRIFHPFEKYEGNPP